MSVTCDSSITSRDDEKRSWKADRGKRVGRALLEVETIAHAK